MSSTGRASQRDTNKQGVQTRAATSREGSRAGSTSQEPLWHRISTSNWRTRHRSPTGFPAVRSTVANPSTDNIRHEDPPQDFSVKETDLVSPYLDEGVLPALQSQSTSATTAHAPIERPPSAARMFSKAPSPIPMPMMTAPSEATYNGYPPGTNTIEYVLEAAMQRWTTIQEQKDRQFQRLLMDEPDGHRQQFQQMAAAEVERRLTEYARQDELSCKRRALPTTFTSR